MKFDFENFKKASKIVGAVAAGITPKDSVGSVQKISHEELNPPAISAPIAEKNQVNSENTVQFDFEKHEEKEVVKKHESLDVLVNKINALEDSLEARSVVKGSIDQNGVVIISESEITHDHTNYNHPINDNFLSSQVALNMFDLINTETVKMYARDVGSLNTIKKEVQVMKEMGSANPQYKIKHTKPAYYFVIGQNEVENDSVEFTIKMISLSTNTSEKIGSVKTGKNELDGSGNYDGLSAELSNIVKNKIVELKLGEK